MCIQSILTGCITILYINNKECSFLYKKVINDYVLICYKLFEELLTLYTTKCSLKNKHLI